MVGRKTWIWTWTRGREMEKEEHSCMYVYIGVARFFEGPVIVCSVFFYFAQCTRVKTLATINPELCMSS